MYKRVIRNRMCLSFYVCSIRFWNCSEDVLVCVVILFFNPVFKQRNSFYTSSGIQPTVILQHPGRIRIGGPKNVLNLISTFILKLIFPRPCDSGKGWHVTSDGTRHQSIKCKNIQPRPPPGIILETHSDII